MNSREAYVELTEAKLRRVENELEEIGKSISMFEGSGESWGYVNRAIEDIQEAIHNAYRMI